MGRARVKVSLALLSQAIFNGEVDVLMAEPSNFADGTISLLIEGAELPDLPGPPEVRCIITIQAPLPQPRYEFKPD
jgi:hypothetical protein